MGDARCSVRTNRAFSKGKSEKYLLIVNGNINLIKYIIDVNTRQLGSTEKPEFSGSQEDSLCRPIGYRDQMLILEGKHLELSMNRWHSHGVGHGK
jgi:hypothetical protein